MVGDASLAQDANLFCWSEQCVIDFAGHKESSRWAKQQTLHPDYNV